MDAPSDVRVFKGFLGRSRVVLRASGDFRSVPLSFKGFKGVKIFIILEL